MENELASVTIRVYPTDRDRLYALAPKRKVGQKVATAADLLKKLLDKHPKGGK